MRLNKQDFVYENSHMKEARPPLKANYGLYLMKIVAMLFIIMHHCIVHGCFLLEKSLKEGIGVTNLVPYEQTVLIIMNTVCVTGVNCFFLISGYFRIRITVKKIIGILLQVYLVYTIIAIAGILVGSVECNYRTIIGIIDAVDTYWYIFVYVVLMLASPFLNIIIEHMDEQLFKYFLLFYFGVFCFYGFAYDQNLHIKSGYSFLNAGSLYIIGGGIAKYSYSGLRRIIPKWLSKISTGFIYILAVTANSIITVVFNRFNGLAAWHCFAYNNPLIVIESICLLVFFKDLRINNSTIQDKIYKLSKATLMVYLLHSTNWLAGKYLKVPVAFIWNKFGFITSVVMLPVYAFIVFLCCYIIDCLYKAVMTHPRAERVQSKENNTDEN